MVVHEGAVEIEAPDQPEAGKGESVFFNPAMELNRDVTVATLRAFRERQPRAHSYLDATAATGIRGVRAAADGWNVTLCDRDPEAVELCEANLARNGLSGEVLHRNANALMHERWFDVVDIDPFGTPIPFADAAFNSARHLVCVTATDTAPLCGAHFQSGVRKYSAVPRNTDYHAEMGLRTLLSAMVRTAARYDVGARPILSHVTRHYVRTYLELERSATDANRAIDELGYVHHCQDCLHRTHERGLIADPPETCPLCGSNRAVTAGPLYLGPAHDSEFVATVREHVTDDVGEAKAARKLLETIEGELHEPTHFDQHKLYKGWGEPAIGMDEFLDAIRDAGFAASRSHYGGTTFKTPANVAEIRDAIVGREGE
jgi:tRNA (guanine26-N2/guanine27-N2)-dimethyltransferase